MIETTDYDAMGRVVRTRRLMENRLTVLSWETTLYGFDPLGRQVKVIRIASQPDYNLTADHDLSGYVPGTDPDVDMVTITAYDVQGRVMYTEDSNGYRTWTAYDGMNRVVKTIVNARSTATSDGSANDPRSDSYVPSSAPDEDLITRTVYDSDGRVQTTEDPLGRKTYFVYDAMGRTIRTVSNWVDQGESPALWVFNGLWKKSNGTSDIDQGYLYHNLVTRTVYDAQGRV